MPRSGFYTQKCPCGSDRKPLVSVTLSASTLRIVPRNKSHSITFYVCEQCLEKPKPRARAAMIEAIQTAGLEATNQI